MELRLFGKENSNFIMGNVGIGTSTNLNSNLTVQGRSLFNDIASFSNSIYQSNITTSNILMGNVSIGTVGISTHKLNVAGTVNVSGILTGTTINASTALQEGGTSLTSKYLKLDGTNSMSAALTFATGAWNKSTEGIDRFNYSANGPTYFHSGNTTGYCFIFKNTLNTAEIFGIDNIGNIGLGSTYQLLINPPTASSPASFQTIQQGVGNNQNITFQSAANSGNVAIGTVDPLGYKLYVNGTTYFNGDSIINGTLSATNIYNKTDVNNLLYYKTDINNLLYDNTYTIERKYPPKLFNSSSSNQIITYLNQTPIYNEIFILNTDNITYGSGAYEVYSSSIDNSFPAYTSATLNTVTGSIDYSYLLFNTSGTLTFYSSTICDILVVGGGGGGGNSGSTTYDTGGGGGGGGVVYMVNKQLNSGTYNIVVGNGGAADTNGFDSKITDISNNNITFDSISLVGKGGGKGAIFGGVGGNGGSGGGGTHPTTNGGVATQGNTFWNGSLYIAGGFNGGKPTANTRGAGGGGAREIGDTDGAGYGGDGVQVNITGVNTYYAGGGNAYPNTTSTRSDGGGGILLGGSGLANTGGGGSGGFNNNVGLYTGGTGGSGVVIIRFLTPGSSIITKKELFNSITNDSGCSFKPLNYNTTTGYYLYTDRYIINDYYGDWVIIKVVYPYRIFLTKYRIYNRTSYVERAPSLFKIYGSIDGINYEEIIDASNNTTPLTSSSYTSGYYEKIVNYFGKYYQFIGLVVNKIIGSVAANANLLNFTEFEIYGKEFKNNIYTLKTEASQKLENQTNYTYPPSVLSNLSSTNIQTLLYGNGVYTISASSFALTKEPFKCFNLLTTDEWSPSTSSYTGASGNYAGSTYSTVVSGVSYNGEWIQLYYDKGFAANSFTITGLTGSNNKCPSNFILGGSVDEKNWILLSSQTGINFSGALTQTFSIYNYTSYNYYRIIVTKTFSDATLSIAGISFTGNQNTSFTNRDEYNITMYNTNEKQFPPRIYDSFTAETTTSTEIYNTMPSTVYKQTLTVNNHGIYTIYSSSTYGSIYKNLLFNFTLSSEVGAAWGSFYTGSSTTYSQPNGTYAGGTTHYIVSGYYGDWIIVKLPYKIILTRFIFYQRADTISRAPAKWKCYGSNDGINFTEITDASNTSTDAVYSSFFTTKTLPSYFDIPYLYIGWTINKLVGGNPVADLLNFNEIQIFGKDDIANSYLSTNRKC
jgi:hypothetical protein